MNWKNFIVFLIGLVLLVLINLKSESVFSASSDFTIDTYKINNNGAGPYTFNPGEEFEIYVVGINNTDYNLTGVFVNIEFSDNGKFDYNGTNHETKVGGTTITDPVPSSAYTSNKGLNYKVTDENNPVTPGLFGDPAKFVDKDNQSGFFPISNISGYKYDMTAYFTGINTNDGTVINGESKTKTLYINVKPHISDYYFEKDGSKVSSITNDGSDSIDLILKVKDYNGYTNIDGGNITADLSDLGLGTSESLNLSGNIDGNTVEFRKNGITTTVSSGDYYFGTGEFEAIDEDNNIDDWDDPYFSGDDKKTVEKLTVESPGAPSVTITSLSDDYIGGPNEHSSVVKFTGDQNGSGKIVTNGNSDCSSGNVVKDWFDYVDGNMVSGTIYTGDLDEGSNTIDICLKNSNGKIGASNVSIEKDTSSPSVNSFSLSPGTVTTEDSSVSFECSEDGSYKACINSGSVCSTQLAGRTSVNKDIQVTTNIPNSNLATGDNEIQGFCKDKASNQGIYTGTVTKEEPTPSMSGYVDTLSDNDVDHEGLDGRDVTISWDNTPGVNYSGFESWRIYVLQSSTSLDASNQNYIKLIADSNVSKWTGSDSITKDSAGKSFISGSDYDAYVAIMGSNGNLGEFGKTNTATLYGDNTDPPSLSSAEFVNDTGMVIDTDVTLDSDLGSHSGGLISYSYKNSTYTGKSVVGVNGNSITIEIPSLNNLAATGTNLEVITGALHSDNGGYNDYIYSGDIVIGDKQNPEISDYSKDTVAGYTNGKGDDFFEGFIDFSWKFLEDMAGSVTKFEFDRVSGNSANNQEANLTSSDDIYSGSHSKSINLSGSNSDEVALNCGTEYKVRIYGEDKAGNSNTTSYINNIWYDSCPPDKVSLNKLDTVGTGNVDLIWNIPEDDNGNGVGVKDYELNFYNGTGCSNLSGNYNLSSTGKSFSLSNGDYSWKVRAFDNMNNTGNYSNCDDFTVDDTVPEISNAFIKDTELNDKFYTTSGNDVNVQADISNTDSDHIWLKMSSLAGASYGDVQCSNVADPNITCDYSNGTVTYNFPVAFSGSVDEGTNQVKFTVQNSNGANEQTEIISITVDNTAPSVTTDAINQPNGGEIWGGTKDIKWDTSKISDSIGLDYIKIEYSTGAGVWNFIHSGANSSPYSWDLSSLNGGTGYKVRITAFDNVKLSGYDISDNTFSVDGENPVISGGIINNPVSGDLLKGGDTVDIFWNTGYISDDITTGENFNIDFEYSADNGTNWNTITTGETNDGVYTWYIPTVDTTQGKLKMIVYDEAGNSTSYDIDYNFSIDSTSPSLDVTYATEGGSTPPNGSYINDSGFDISASVSDNIALSGVYYRLKNSTDNDYWDTSSKSWTGNNRNLFCTSSCGNSFTGVDAIIENEKNYTLNFRAKDDAGNESFSTDIGYDGDTQDPKITSLVNSGDYFSGVADINGTGFDNYEIGSVTIQILKGGNNYWDGSSFQSGEETLSASGTTDWNYIFNMPDTDSEGQKYEVNYAIEDTSYKVNNASSGSINIYKDTEGPSITTGGDFWNAPTGGTVVNGGVDYQIDRNSGNISDSLAGMGDNPLKIEYYNGASWSIVTGNTENDGVYTWNVPQDETNSAKLKITVEDKIGNTSFTESDFFTVDSNPPSLTGLQTMDKDANGQIDALYLSFTEKIDDSTVDISDFSVSDGISLSGWDTAGSADDNEIELIFANTGDTSTTPSLSYTKGGLEDLAGNKLESFTDELSEDGAVPRLEKAEIYDDDGNGKVDLIKSYFSEDIQNTNDTTAWSINNKLDGLSISGVSTNSNVANIDLNEPNSFDSSTGGMSLNFSSNSNWLDFSDNQAGSVSDLELVDKATPVFVEAVTNDTDGNYKNDEIKLTLSESVTGFDINEFDIYNLSTGSSLNGGNLTNNKISFSVDETTEDNDTNVKPDIDYTGSSLQDFSNNTVNNYIGYNVEDKIPPKLLSRQTYDANGNGKIDAIKLDFSENLNDDFSGLGINVDGYVVSGHTTENSQDKIMYVQVNEKSIYDSDETPAVQISSNGSLGDTGDNLVKTEDTAKNAADNIGPVIQGARYDEDQKIIYTTFSENFSGSLTSGDFELSGSAMSISGVVSTSNTNEAEVHLSGSDGVDYGVDEISFASDSVKDEYGNTQSTTYFVKISASVVINEIMWSVTGAGNYQYLEFRNLASSSISLSGWSIKNAGGSGVDISFSSSDELGASGYYLMTSGTNKFDVNPDLNTGDLSLSTGDYNLILKDDNDITIDTVRTDFSPLIGDNDTPKSMERKDSPGDGLSSDNWYTAETSSGFSTTIPKGTPGKENVFDGISPNITYSSPVNNTLMPHGQFDIIFKYEDNNGGVGIDKSTADITLKKWDGSNYNDVTNTGLNNGSVTLSKATYPTNNLSYGKYKVSLSIDDKAGNTESDSFVFYVDNLQIDIDKNNIDIGTLRDGVKTFSTNSVTITVKTVGAGFDIQLEKDGNLIYGNTEISSNDWGYDKDDGSGYSDSITPVDGSTIISHSKSINTTGNLNIYTYDIRYGAQINTIQPAGQYDTDTVYDLIISY